MRQADGSFLYEEVAMHLRQPLPQGRKPVDTATHIGMYITWCWLSGLGHIGEMIMHDRAFDTVRRRATTPGVFFFTALQGRFTDRLLNVDGNVFTAAYYHGESRAYLDDYIGSWGRDYPSLLHAPDSWALYDALAPKIDHRLAAWRNR